jgi:hypothetical protein
LQKDELELRKEESKNTFAELLGSSKQWKPRCEQEKYNLATKNVVALPNCCRRWQKGYALKRILPNATLPGKETWMTCGQHYERTYMWRS